MYPGKCKKMKIYRLPNELSKIDSHGNSITLKKLHFYQTAQVIAVNPDLVKIGISHI
jgi:hypothetical protein